MNKFSHLTGLSRRKNIMKIIIIAFLTLLVSCVQLTEAEKLEKLSIEVQGKPMSVAGDMIKRYFPEAEEANINITKWGGYLTYSLPGSKELVIKVYRELDFPLKSYRDPFKCRFVYVYKNAKLKIRPDQTNTDI